VLHPVKKWLISGSVAIKHWFPDFTRNPADIDLLTPATISTSDTSTCFVDASWHDACDLIFEMNKDTVFVDADILFTLKVTHAEWDVKWEKTMYDVHFLKNAGCKLVPELIAPLHKVWEKLHGKKRVNLNRRVDEFFIDAVNRIYDHEYLHIVLSFEQGKPMHTLLRRNETSVWCDKGLFEQLSHEQQMLTALEEILVVAVERKKLTSGMKKSEYLAAFTYAHKLLCTSMTTGWFARFLILNKSELFCMRDVWFPHLLNRLDFLQHELLNLEKK
jgi:hypothetical protein